MGSMSSNGTKAFRAKPKGIGGGYFAKRQAESRGFMWSEVDGDRLRMTLDALGRRGYGMAFFVAPGGRGIKVRMYAEGPPSDAVVIDGEEMNGLLDWVLNDLIAGDADLLRLFEDVSTWIESRES